MEADALATGRLLRAMREGDSEAARELLSRVYGELRGVAGRVMGARALRETLQPTALIHEAWMRLGAGAGIDWADRAHFLRVAARAMRQVLVEHARARLASKRGGGAQAVALEGLLTSWTREKFEMLDLHEALEELGRIEPEAAEIVELRYFGGLTLEETARVLDKTARQVQRSWTFARGWLRRRMERGGATPAAGPNG